MVPLLAPPLRDRKEDVPLLAQHFVASFNKRNGTLRTLTHGALRKLMEHDFPGNVRDLENVVEQAAALAQRDEIGADDVLVDARPPNDKGPRTLAQEVDEAEKRTIEASLERNDGLLERVARELDVSTTTLWRKMKRLNLRRD